MAKKKDEGLKYLQMPLPSGRKASKMTKRSWTGLNMRQTIDTGALSRECNISTLEAPYLVPSERREIYMDGYTRPISLFGFDDFLIMIYRAGDSVYVDYITADDEVYTGMLQNEGASSDDEFPRSVVQFNVYDTPTDPIDGKYIKKLLFFPDKASMFMNIVSAGSNPEDWAEEELNEADTDVMYCYDDGNDKYYYVVNIIKTTDEDGEVSYSREVTQKGVKGYFSCDGMSVLIKEYINSTAETDESGATIYPPPESAGHEYYYKNTYNEEVYRYREYETEDGGTAYGWKVETPPAMPPIKYATVHLSRLFGVSDDRVYASGYNDYTNWNIDTVDGYNESNAWCTPAQSNTKAGGVFTGITTFQSHVICFKRDFMHEIYNTKNPFRIQDIFAEGTIDNRTIQDVDGRLIFVSGDDVKIYTGSNPRIIGYYLNMKEYTKAVSGTDGRCYYLYCEDANNEKRLFVYDTLVEQWSEQSIDVGILNFAYNKNGMYMLSEDGEIFKMDTDNYKHSWSFETDLITNQTVDIKHVKKIQMFAEIADGAKINVYLLYDDDEFDEDTSHLVYSSDRYGQTAIRVKPRQTANYGVKIHVEGYGYVRLYELEIVVAAGGDLYV